MKAPKRIWVDEPDVFIKPVTDDEVEYVRADLVDPLVAELDYVSCLYRGHQGHYEARGDMRRAEANAARAKAIEDALKALREA